MQVFMQHSGPQSSRGAPAGGTSGSQQQSGIAQEQLRAALQAARDLLLATGRTLDCTPEEQLVQAAAEYARTRLLQRSQAAAPATGQQPRHKAPGAGATQAGAQGAPLFLLASNLYNSQEVLPNVLLQLIQLVLLMPPGTFAVSVYESGSTDTTPAWLALLGSLLCPLGVRAHVAAGGTLSRARDDATERAVDRIAFLAQVRNAALGPLLWGDTRGQGPAQGAGPPPPKAQFERVVFLNDVFFCAGDALRLLALGQDMACGVDLHSEGILQPWDRRPLWLYDSWVARDTTGAMITGSFPDMDDTQASERARRGLPFAVHCCWNGIVALNAQPFYQGLRFRPSQPGECRASECSLMCDDMHRLGRTRVAMDPGVRVTYRWHHANAALHDQRSFDPQLSIRPTSWGDLVAASLASNATPLARQGRPSQELPSPGAAAAAPKVALAAPAAPPASTEQVLAAFGSGAVVPPRASDYAHVLCCHKRLDSDSIPWDQCHRRSIVLRNFTQQTLVPWAS